MSLKKSELEEMNQRLRQALQTVTHENTLLHAEILGLQAQNKRLQEALEKVSENLRKRREQWQKLRGRYQKLTDYVKRLHAWAASANLNRNKKRSEN